jgi:hypothetical protein
LKAIPHGLTMAVDGAAPWLPPTSSGTQKPILHPSLVSVARKSIGTSATPFVPLCSAQLDLVGNRQLRWLAPIES